MPFFSRIPVDKKQIEAAISRLESLSSAEVRVYIERKVPQGFSTTVCNGTSFRSVW